MKKFNSVHNTSTAQAEGFLAHTRPLAVRIPEAVRLTGIGRTKLYSLMASGEVATVKIGRSTLIPMASLEALLHEHQQHRSAVDR